MPNASEPNFTLTQCDFQFHHNLWVIRAHQDICPCRRAFSKQPRLFAYLCSILHMRIMPSKISKGLTKVQDFDVRLTTWLSTRSLSTEEKISFAVFAPCLRIDSSANQDRKSFITGPERALEFLCTFCRHHCCSSRTS